MGKKSAPAAPDYTKAAEQTSASNQQAQTRADWANRPTTNTPWGSQSWQASAGTDPATGQPVTNWTQNITLDPRQQRALDDQMAITEGKSGIAQGMLGRLGEAYQKPFDWSGLPAAPTGDAAERQRIEGALFDRMKPVHQQQQSSLENQLRGQGLSRGSEAWNREMQRMGDQQSRERFDALMVGGQEQGRQFDMGSRARQQGISEQTMQRQTPLNELNALLTGQQVGMPEMPRFNASQSAGGTNYSAAAGQQYNAALDSYNARQGAMQGLFSGLGGLAGLGIMGFGGR